MVAPLPSGVLEDAERAREIEAELAIIAGQQNRLVGRTVGLVAEAIEDELCIGHGSSARRWVAWQFGCTPTHADKIVSVAQRRAELPTLMGALADGAVSLDQAAVIARRVPASHDGEAVEKASVTSPSQLGRWARTCPPLDDDASEPVETPEGDAPEPEPGKRHGLSLHPVSDDASGDWIISGRLPGDDALTLDALLRAWLDAEWNKLRRGERDGEPSLLDALAALARHGFGPSDAPLAKAAVLVHVDIDSQVAEAHLGPALPASLRRYLTCDATFRVVYERAGIALGIDRASRAIPERTRRIVEHRDQGCRVPGCGSKQVEIHHVIHWEHGGVTETWNLVALCKNHHRLHHRGRLGIAGFNADDHDGITFTVNGRQLRNRPPPVTGDALPAPPGGSPYQRPEPRVVTNTDHVPATPDGDPP